MYDKIYIILYFIILYYIINFIYNINSIIWKVERGEHIVTEKRQTILGAVYLFNHVFFICCGFSKYSIRSMLQNQH